MAANSSKKNFSLRLDNGSIIGRLGAGSATPAVISVDKAQQLGRLSDRDFQRLQRCLAQVGGQSVPSFPNGALPAKHPLEADGHEAPAKRPKHSGAAVNGVADAPAASPSQISKDGPMSSELVAKCLEILRGIRKELGNMEYGWFAVPVDPKVVTDYYKIIKEPMDLGTVEKQLLSSQYHHPQDFCDDVRKVWVNCQMYNNPESVVGKVGARASRKFEWLWSSMGLQCESGRSKRVTAGVAAEKFDPGLAEAVPTKTRSASKGPKNGTKHKSHEVTSGHPRQIPQDALQWIAATLPELEETNMLQALDFINPEAKGTDEEGNMELDFDKLKYENFEQLNAFLQRLNSQGGQPRHQGSSGSESDSGYSS